MFCKQKIAAICLAAISVSVGCQKKVSSAAPPLPPPPAATPAPVPPPPVSSPAIAQFEAEPTSIQRGQSSTLRWEVTGDFTNVSIDHTVGSVQKTGNRRVFPSESTTYTLTVTGAGGMITALATINVSSPPPPPLPPPALARSQGTFDERIASDLQDAFFDYGKSDIRVDAGDILARDAMVLKTILRDFPNGSLVIEGHCDDRGSAEFNVGLGDQRASSAMDLLVRSGVPAERLKTISYGKERPQCIEPNESCWQRNRRVHFSTAN